MLNEGELTTNIFQNECKFVLGVGKLSQIPAENIPEVAFWGRSNVGKSSLINTLINRKNFVRVSKTPGRTKEINYFTINNLFYLVDLPGYGYAKVSKAQKMQWNDLVIQYVQNVKNLKRLYLLIDARVGFKDIDIQIMSFLNHYGRSYQIVFTKTEKVSKAIIAQLQADTEALLLKNPACFPEFIFSSSKIKLGIESLKQAIVVLLNK